MEYIISTQNVGCQNVPVWCQVKSEHYYLTVDMEKFTKNGKQTVPCRCGFEEFVIQRKTVVDIEGKKKEV